MLIKIFQHFLKEENSTLRAQLVSGASFRLDAFALFTSSVSQACVLQNPLLLFLLCVPLRQSVFPKTLQEGELRGCNQGLCSRRLSRGQSGSAVRRLEVPATGPVRSWLAGGWQHPLPHRQPALPLRRIPPWSSAPGLPR